MRISDWSSDVCSSDLINVGFGRDIDGPTRRISHNLDSSWTFKRISAYHLLRQSSIATYALDRLATGGLDLAYPDFRASARNTIDRSIHIGAGSSGSPRHTDARRKPTHGSSEERRVGQESVSTGRSR